MTRLSSPRVVLPAGLAAAALTVVSGRRTWLTGTGDDPVLGSGRVDATGTQVVPGLVALALVVAAAVVAAATAGALLRRLTLIAAGVAGLAVAALAGRALLDADAALGTIAAEASGRTGQVAVSATASIWPYAVLAAGLLAAAAAVLGLSRAASWRGLGQRYEAPAGGDVAGARGQRVASAWERLDRGEDPTSTEPADPAPIAADDLPESDQPGPGHTGPRS
ncbi:MAG: Trp biosynthesis-associated membrane protein [Tetrasphaera sp.]